jgi:predicted TIM-barrel enzyme
MAADVAKIKTMRAAIGDHPLAIASGITPGNVHLYLPYVDCFLVASGISDSYSELNEGRVRELVAALGR